MLRQSEAARRVSIFLRNSLRYVLVFHEFAICLSTALYIGIIVGRKGEDGGNPV